MISYLYKQKLALRYKSKSYKKIKSFREIELPWIVATCPRSGKENFATWTRKKKISRVCPKNFFKKIQKNTNKFKHDPGMADLFYSPPAGRGKPSYQALQEKAARQKARLDFLQQHTQLAASLRAQATQSLQRTDSAGSSTSSSSQSLPTSLSQLLHHISASCRQFCASK